MLYRSADVPGACRAYKASHGLAQAVVTDDKAAGCDAVMALTYGPCPTSAKHRRACASHEAKEWDTC